ncbi:pilus assembly protein [Dyella jiangningensis]|nr:pilus assembly protein [Dyella jiangningensis]
MIQALALFSLVLLLLAAAIELWSGNTRRVQQQRSLQSMEQRLTLSAGGDVNASALPPAPKVRPKMAQRIDAILLRAGLASDRPYVLLLVVPGLVLAALTGWRIGSPWATPMMLGLYGACAWLWLRRRIEQQRMRLLAQLPDFLDGMVRMASVGNSLPMAFQSTTKSVGMPLRAVLDRTLHGMHNGMDLDQALHMAARPYAMEELSLLHAVLGIGMRVGGRADQILQRMSDFMRDHSHATAELGAITAETRMSSWVLALLPVAVATFMTLMNPAFFTPMFHQPLGHRLLLIALGLEITGALMLYRLARSL